MDSLSILLAPAHPNGLPSVDFLPTASHPKDFRLLEFSTDNVHADGQLYTRIIFRRYETDGQRDCRMTCGIKRRCVESQS